MLSAPIESVADTGTSVLKVDRVVVNRKGNLMVKNCNRFINMLKETKTVKNLEVVKNTNQNLRVREYTRRTVKDLKGDQAVVNITSIIGIDEKSRKTKITRTVEGQEAVKKRKVARMRFDLRDLHTLI